MSTKTKVNVVMGGPSAEYEVSLRSGEQVLSYLDRSKYDLRAVVITKNKQFYYADVKNNNNDNGNGTDVPDIQNFSSPSPSPSPNNNTFIGPFHPSNSKQIWDNCDAAFLALHGEFGEDGTIQGYLDALGIPYTGSNVYASAVAMNKITSKFLYVQSALPVPEY